MNTDVATREFPRDVESLDAIFQLTSKFAATHHLSKDLMSSVDLAVEEVFVNMVEHNPEAQSDITISLCLAGGSLEIIIIDPDALPFDLTKMPDVDTTGPIHERPVGGLGIHLTKKLMDDVTFDYDNGTGTIRLIKKLEPGHV